MSFTAGHLERLDAALFPPDVASIIVTKTFLKGRLFSFKDHEYQEYIVRALARIRYIRKPSQCGVTEVNIRRVLVLLKKFAGTIAIYVMPTATFAGVTGSTRFNPVIESSPYFKDSLYPGNDSSVTKRFVNDSFLHLRGASRTSQTISIPCDFLTIDEEDFAEDPDVLSNYTSRLTHSEHKDETHISTPTFPGRGISLGFENSVRHIPMQQCQRCNHWFVVDYYKHVVLPGFSPRPLMEINFFSKRLLAQYDVSKAYVRCPSCRRKVDIHDQGLKQYVRENPDSNFEAHGFQVSPFQTPIRTSPAELIKTSTKYRRKIDFVNNGLGLPDEDETTGLMRAELDLLFHEQTSGVYPDPPVSMPPFQVTGTDMGGQCAHLTGYPAPDGHLRVTHAELIPLSKIRTRFTEILATQRVICSVMDALPYTETLTQMQKTMPSLWGSLYSQTQSLKLYDVAPVQEDETKAMFGIRYLNVYEQPALDYLVGEIRNGNISFAPAVLPLKELMIEHFTDMKRLEIPDKYGDSKFVWRKSEIGIDHFFHALLYLLVASKIKGLTTGHTPLPILAAKVRNNGRL